MARVSVLGPVELLDDSAAPIVLTPRIRRLLAALAVRTGEVATVDWLAEAVWGTEVPEHPGNAVQTLVSRLRRAIRDGGGRLQVVTRPEGYLLAADTQDLDAALFRGSLAQARVETEPERRTTLLTEALHLWHGDAYGALADEPFIRDDAVALTELRASAVADLAELELDAGRAGLAHERLSALIIDRPYDERPALLLMRCLQSSGRTAEALAVYADLRRRLRDDLGLEPSPEARDAHRDLLRPQPDTRAIGLPAAADVYGRSRDERALAARLTSARLVTVLGPGGLGKTTLAYRVARQLVDDFADGVVVTELARLEPGDDIAAAVCTVLQVPTGRTGPRQQLFDSLRGRHLLLVLDNCEHLIDAVDDLVERLLAECPGVTVLATSRVALRLGSEHVFRLEPLPIPAAVELFRRRAQQRLTDFRLTDDTRAAIAELCRRLDGLPLAIELAASRVDVITPVELLDRWSWHRTVLRGRAADPRHRSLTAMVDWSYDRLPTAAQWVFECVCVFAGEFSLGDAADLIGRAGEAGDPSGSLATLVDSSMIIRSPASGRLQVLETLRAYGRARLAGRPDGARVVVAHAELFADRAVATRDELYGPGQVTAVRRLLASVDELRAAFGWALEHRAETAARIAGGAALLVEHAMLGEAVGWAEAVLARPDGPKDAWVCAVAAAGARFSGDLDRAADLAEEAVRLASGDAGCLAYGLSLRCEVALFAGDLPTVLDCRDRVARLERGHPEVAGTAQMTDAAAMIARRYAGEPVSPQEAITLRIVAERHGRSVLAAWGRYLEGELLLSDDPARAAGPLEEALRLGRALGDEYLTGVALVSAASAAHRSGRLADARKLFSEVIRHWRIRGDLTHQWTTLRNVVQVLLASDRRSDALALAAALLVRPGGSGFGADAEQLADAVEQLTVGLGPGAADALDHGRSLRDDQVVELGLRALTEDGSGQDSR